jgi:hypothetical protein
MGKPLKGHVIYIVYSFAMEPIVSFTPLQYHTYIYELCTFDFYINVSEKKPGVKLKMFSSFINR